MTNNKLAISLFEQFSTTAVSDPAGDLLRARIEYYETQYPRGLYGSAMLFIPRDVTDYFLFKGGNRVVFRNGQTVVYEGEILNIGYRIEAGAIQGITIECAGYWGTLLQRRLWEKRWADNRLSQWIPTTAYQESKFDIRPYNLTRIKALPKDGISYAAGEKAEFGRYLMPWNGGTIKKLTFDYDNAENSPTTEWNLGLWNPALGADDWQATTTASGSVTETLTNATDDVIFYWYNNKGSTQTGVGDDTQYGEISNIVVFGETGSIDPTEIIKDCRAFVTDLNSDEANIGANTLTLEPFYTNGVETVADIMDVAASFGDSSQNQWAVYLRESDFAATPDGKPVVVYEQYPALSSFDYAIRLDEPNLDAPFEIMRDFGSIANWIVVTYKDTINQLDTIKTPDDDATLKDTTSITDYGQRDYLVRMGAADATTAVNLGKRYLATLKDPQFFVSGPIRVVGWIRGSGGERIPAARIKAGTVLKVENFLEDLTSTSGAGLSFIVTRTRYDPETETCDIYTGTASDNLAIVLAQMQAGII